MSILHPRLVSELTALRAELTANGTLRPRSQLQTYYDTFRRAFGPEVLHRLDGLELLERMHAHGNRDSLVYWLEFKDDDELPSIFGSIAGGSALKFGVFRRRETGTWAARGEGPVPRDISVEEGIDIARRHRDQLLAASAAIEALPRDASDDTYIALQVELERIAPDVQDTAWGHKYLSLLYPESIEDFHVVSHQNYHLIRTLQFPVVKEGNKQGRFVSAGRYVAMSRELGIPLHHVAGLMYYRNGGPRNYWRVGTTDDPGDRAKFWSYMRDTGVMSIGWPEVGDLSDTQKTWKSRDEIAARVREKYGSNPQAAARAASQLLKFAATVEPGDRVLAADGQTIVGVGEIDGPYRYDPRHTFAHKRKVNWLSDREWRAADAEGLRTSLVQIRDVRNQIEAERRILEDAGTVVVGSTQGPNPISASSSSIGTSTVLAGALPRLQGTPGQVQAVLERKGQVIIYGPPGTGKTYWALSTARDLAALRRFGNRFDTLEPDQKQKLLNGEIGSPAAVVTCSFHPEYGYEDFIGGFRPYETGQGQLGFRHSDGVFRRFCADAAVHPELEFYLIIDEINRGDIPRIFGELLTLLEKDKRGQVIRLADGSEFTVPPNVFVIGTMNTADRSIALLDVALRRRFGFVELMPEYSVLRNVVIAGLPLGPWLRDLNERIRAMGAGDARNRQIGHAFLLEAGKPITSPEQLAAALRDDIIPLLEEYCYDEFDQLADILGKRLIDLPNGRIRKELLEPGRTDELIAALERPEIATSSESVIATDDQLASEAVPDDDDMIDDAGGDTPLQSA